MRAGAPAGVRTRARRGAAACAWLLACAYAGASEWPCWRGPERSGVAAGEAPGWARGEAPLEVLWRAQVGTGFSSFAVAGGRALTIGNAGGADTVWCFDAASGAVRWTHTYPCELQPLSYEGGPGSTPAIAEGRAYTFSKGGDLFCLDLADGRVLWQRAFAPWPRRAGDWKNTWRYAGSPLVRGGRLYLSVGEAGAAFDAPSGAPLWASVSGHPGYSSPVPFDAAGEPALAFFSGHGVAGVRAADGAPLWTIPWRTEWDFNAADPVVSAGRVFVSSGNNAGGALYAVGEGAPREVWRNRHLKTPMCGAVLWQGHLYGFNDADLACVAWDTGELKWSDRSLRRGSAVVAGGLLVALSEEGTLAVAPASPEGFRPHLRQRVLDGRCWTSPALAGGRLYLRNAKGEAVCCGSRAAGGEK